MTATGFDVMLQELGELKQMVRAQSDFIVRVSALAVRLAEQGNPVALELLAAMDDYQALTGEFVTNGEDER